MLLIKVFGAFFVVCMTKFKYSEASYCHCVCPHPIIEHRIKPNEHRQPIIHPNAVVPPQTTNIHQYHTENHQKQETIEDFIKKTPNDGQEEHNLEKDEHNHKKNVHYKFEYAVNDKKSGDVKNQKEERHGDVVRGEYSLLEADGNVRTVKYYADWKRGFFAEIHNSKHGN